MTVEEEKFKLLESQMAPYVSLLAKASDTILDKEVSSYPIFVAYRNTSVNIGLELLSAAPNSGDWSFNASTLEEFAAKQLIQPARVDHFREIFKSPSEHLCLFVVDEFGATFVFIPRR
ncbi:MAG: hypothetical protein AAGG75_00570 [Bacteroidota bacterium]